MCVLQRSQQDPTQVCIPLTHGNKINFFSDQLELVKALTDYRELQKMQLSSIQTITFFFITATVFPTVFFYEQKIFPATF